MKIPNKITIKGCEFKIKFEDLKVELFGDFTEIPAVIRINEKADKNFQGITLFHEVLHILRSDIKEQWIKDFAWDLWQFLKDNNLLKE